MSAGMGRWAFGEFVLDTEAHELVRAGRPVALSPKAFTLLRLLVEQRSRALSKGELQDHLWPGTFVVEKNLTNLVGEIREALHDDAARPRFIRTVPRFGYAFIEAAAVPTPDMRRHNLPAQLTSFVGRTREIMELTRLLPLTRLLTLTGAGGSGKTRLGLAVGRGSLDRFSDGIWLVDLAPLSDAGLVPEAVASAVDVRQAPMRTPIETLSDYLRTREALLILDNCEHLIAACAHLAETLLHAAPRLRILATSREALHVAGERVWRVPPLSQDEALTLFGERATAVEPAFTLTAANNPTVTEICTRLDGIPLAIELAAARLNVLSVEQIRSRLDDRFRLLADGPRTARARQRTLEATVAWSYDLLSEPERLLLRRLSVFAGRWQLEAAETVCSGAGLEPGDALDLLSRLMDKSLVLADAATAGARQYRFLETVRQYARERLTESGEADRVRNRHLDFFSDLVRRIEPELTRADQVRWLNQLESERDNLRQALEWSLASAERAQYGLRIANALLFFWLKRAYFAEGQKWLERALAANPDAPPVLRAWALLTLANMTFFQGDFARTRALVDESAALARAAGDRFVTSFALGIGAIAELELGNLAEAERLATSGTDEGRLSHAPWVQGPSLACLAYTALHAGDAAGAGRRHEEALELFRAQGEIWATTIALFDLALLRIVQERFADARALCAEAIALCQQFGDRRGIGYCLGILAGAKAAEGQNLRAAQLRGAMDGVLETIGSPVQPTYDRWIGERYFPAVRESLGEAQFAAAMREGRAMSMAHAIELGLNEPSA
jgi:predicted ATPase/DNA-binding winged helix-turn-helix (wHTH) protein